MSYTAILFCVDPPTGQAFSMSREVITDKLEKIYPYLRSEAKVNDDSIDQILLIKNGTLPTGGKELERESPRVLHMWRAAEGHFADVGTKIFTTKEAIAHAKNLCAEFGREWDNQGQIVIYTQIYRWNDGSFRDAPDPNWNG